MTAAHTRTEAPAARHARPTGTMVAAGLAMMVPFVVTVAGILTDATYPGTVAGTYAVLVVEHLVALLGAVVLIGAQVSVQVADTNIGGGLLWFVAAAVLAVLGGVAVADSRRA